MPVLCHESFPALAGRLPLRRLAQHGDSSAGVSCRPRRRRRRCARLAARSLALPLTTDFGVWTALSAAGAAGLWCAAARPAAPGTGRLAHRGPALRAPALARPPGLPPGPRAPQACSLRLRAARRAERTALGRNLSGRGPALAAGPRCVSRATRSQKLPAAPRARRRPAAQAAREHAGGPAALQRRPHPLRAPGVRGGQPRPAAAVDPAAAFQRGPAADRPAAGAAAPRIPAGLGGHGRRCGAPAPAAQGPLAAWAE